MNDLNEVIFDIAATGLNSPDEPHTRAAPTQWDLIKDSPGKFGPNEDFYVEGSVFFAISKAALAWSYSKLPEELDRINVFGFDVGEQWIDFIVHRAQQDKLMSRQDYEQAMNESHEHSLSWL